MDQGTCYEPLGDQAVMAYCADESQAAVLAARMRRSAPVWCIDVVQAYVSIAIYYDISSVDFDHVVAWLRNEQESCGTFSQESRLHLIPCCYDFGLDFERIEAHTRLSREAVIHLHSENTYTIYAIGFCPGFPYLGYLPDELASVPRLASPRLQVEAGSIGLAGRQTGIYTEARPGGWNIIGRTPLLLVDVKAEYFPLRTGDRIQFRKIDEHEYHAWQGRRLE